MIIEDVCQALGKLIDKMSKLCVDKFPGCKYVSFCFLSGISSEIILRPEDISQEELLDMTLKLNKDPSVSGVLVQLPLPGK